MDSSYERKQLDYKLATIKALRDNGYKRRDYAVDVSNFIESQNRIIDKLSLDLLVSHDNVEENEELFRKYNKLRNDIPDYFFRAPKTVSQCYSSMMDALDVLLEDREILLAKEIRLDQQIGRHR